MCCVVFTSSRCCVDKNYIPAVSNYPIFLGAKLASKLFEDGRALKLKHVVRTKRSIQASNGYIRVENRAVQAAFERMARLDRNRTFRSKIEQTKKPTILLLYFFQSPNALQYSKARSKQDRRRRCGRVMCCSNCSPRNIWWPRLERDSRIGDASRDLARC